MDAVTVVHNYDATSQGEIHAYIANQLPGIYFHHNKSQNKPIQIGWNQKDSTNNTE